MHLMDDREPYIYKTTDFGRTWTSISGALPTGHPLDYVMTVAENPHRKGMLFAGTGHAFFYSLDDGKTWTRFQDGLPGRASDVDRDAESRTRRRGVDLRTRAVRAARHHDAGAIRPRGGRRRRRDVSSRSPAFRMARSGNAEFNIRLKAAPKDSIKLEIIDSAGTVVRIHALRRARGAQPPRRGTCDMTDLDQVELRTTPPDNPKIWEEARFKGRQTRAIIHWGIQNPQRSGPLAMPGRYTFRLTVDSAPPRTQSFVVMKDPGLTSADADLAASTRAQVRIRDAMNESVDIINRLEVMRRQIEDTLKAKGSDAALAEQLKALDQKMMDVELMLLSKTDLHSDDKWYVEKYKVYMNLIWLSGEVGTGAGDVAGGAEFRPTDASIQTLVELERDLAAARLAFQKLLETDVKAFNELMGARMKVIMN